MQTYYCYKHSCIYMKTTHPIHINGKKQTYKMNGEKSDWMTGCITVFSRQESTVYVHVCY